MRKVVLTYGILAGLIIAALVVITFSLVGESEGDFSTSYAIGYATMIVSLSMIFFGIRSYRDNHTGGALSFGKAFLVGLYITIIASIFYVITWKIYSSIALPDFMNQYADKVIAGLKQSGATAAEIAEKTKEMEQWKEWYKNPFFEIGMTFMEIFPVGLIISLICAAILKRKPKVVPA